jgi:hypothetical protein
MRKVYLMLFVLILLGNFVIPVCAETSDVKISHKRISTKSADSRGSLYLTIYEPTDNQNHPAFVICPGSWEDSEAWDLYFPPFSREFIAKQGFVVVGWDPRGSFMANPASMGVPTSLDPEKYGIGRSFPPYPPSILMLNETLIDDLYDVITYASNLKSVLPNKITLMGFSHGATYPIIEKSVKKDRRVSTIVSIEPIGDEASLVDMIIGNVPVVGDMAVGAASLIPENLYDRVLWEPLKNIPPHIMGLATSYIDGVNCPLIVMQSEQFHASFTAPIFGGECKLPGVSLYNSATKVPYKRLNRNPVNASGDELTDFFPSPIWNDGDLFTDYFINYIKPVVLRYAGVH